MEPYQIILADDHILLRQGLRRIIEASPYLKVVGEAGDGVELLQRLNTIVPDMVILDISMPNMRGMEAVSEIKARHPEVKILFLTMHRDVAYVHQALTSGADGYVLKDDSDSELFSAIDKIRKGTRYISPQLATDMAECLVRTRNAGDGHSLDGDPLSNRERQILKLVAEGKTSRECAEILCLSSRTVEHHRANLMEKLNIKKNTDLVRYAIKKGMCK